MSEAWNNLGPMPGYEARDCLRCGWLAEWGRDENTRKWWECPKCGLQWKVWERGLDASAGWWSENGMPARPFPWGVLLVVWEEEDEEGL